MIGYRSLRRSLAAQRKWPRAVAMTGALGSGKTTWAVNAGLALKGGGKRIAFADLDIINPYFCLREIASQMEALGVDVALPPGDARWSDIPVVSSEVSRLLVSDHDHLFLDVGGEAKGVLALKQFAPFLEEAGYDFLMVLNPFRPQTCTPQAVLQMRREMERLSGLTVTGLLGNAHLMDQTEMDDVVRGLSKIRRVSDVLELPLLFVGVDESLYNGAQKALPGEENRLWPLTRPILFPWERGVSLDGERTSSD